MFYSLGLWRAHRIAKEDRQGFWGATCSFFIFEDPKQSFCGLYKIVKPVLAFFMRRTFLATQSFKGVLTKSFLRFFW